ncbi:MarR family transcriptional regulator [Clostridium perfringens]|jgi:MarR family 2-MHQ and catechol resistance regulon transcriptional repressor|uniref:HTH-type transcriptional regulator SarZ n=2 Tax=Clostridium perfringens TaxID=1502 RepID=Q8XMA1_CLOPE|nr:MULTISPECIES: MarR family transcriptional regulator [Clostridium]MDU3596627.1 MarR family transcriptional regulator [Clostridium butyricum]AMN32257.1 MarR family transcriptional regulator [Clostridium perfringens]AQW23185.1 MarR family transcriptional regulator [Clostridium perfringens]ASY50935.1 MarR family transcriptional regulator [Clostridium perfringens]ATD49267.1 MarR family transcriptional regulator [Clostridium perfringens]
MDNIKDLIKENELELSTLVVFTRAEHTIHKKEFQTIKESGLTIAQFGVLEVLYNKGDLRICEIIEKILTTSGNITVVIKNLEKDGLVKKNADPEDKRSCIISLTDEGRKVIENILPSHINNIKNIFEVLTDEEKITLKNILKKFKNV